MFPCVAVDQNIAIRLFRFSLVLGRPDVDRPRQLCCRAPVKTHCNHIVIINIITVNIVIAISKCFSLGSY